MAESNVSALSRTTSYVSFEIIPAGLPFLGLTAPISEWLRDYGLSFLTILVQILDNLRETLLGFLVQI